MSSSTMTSGLVSTWVTTVDSHGHSHLEAHWAPATSAVATQAAAPPRPAMVPATTHAA